MAFALRVLNGERAGQSFALTEGRAMTIGRDAANDIRLSDRKMSRIHCQVEIIGGRCQVADLNSTNGTHINGQELDEVAWLTTSDDLEVGTTRLRLEELEEVETGAPEGEGAEVSDAEPSVQTRCEECGRAITEEDLETGRVRQVGDRFYCGNCVATFDEWTVEAESVEPRLTAAIAEQCVPGRELAGVRIISQVGEGRLGPLFKGEQVSMGRLVALKVLNVADTDWAKKYLEAVYTSGQLVHPSIVLVFDTGETEGMYYVIREYVEGKSVEELVAARKPVPLKEAYHVVTETAHALEYGYERRVFHGALSPRKILLGPRNAVKVVGFGLPLTPPAGYNETMFVWQTLPYMAPERLSGEGALDFAGDVYSLVAIFYHMLTGRPPISGSTREKLERRILKRTPKPLREYVPDIQEVAEKIVTRGLSKDPRARYQLPRELLYDLEENLRREL